MAISNFHELLTKKSQLGQFTWLVATESTQKQFWIVSYFFCFCQHFAIVGIFSGYFVKNSTFTQSISIGAVLEIL